MTIPAGKVMELRNITGAGMMDCKRALQETNGDMEQAQDYLRKKGISIAQKKSDRATNEGGIGVSFDEKHHQAAIVRLACETDFVARNEQFDALLATFGEQVLAKGDQDVLDQQALDGSGTVSELLTRSITTLGENLQFIEASRLELSGEGYIGGYVHSNKKIGVLVAISGSGDLETLARDVAMHIAASNVHAISADDLDPGLVAKEKEILIAQAKESGKPDDIIEKMVQGRINKFVKEIVLLDQPFVKNPDQTVAQVVKDCGADLKVEQFLKFHF